MYYAYAHNGWLPALHLQSGNFHRKVKGLEIVLLPDYKINSIQRSVDQNQWVQFRNTYDIISIGGPDIGLKL